MPPESKTVPNAIRQLERIDPARAVLAMLGSSQSTARMTKLASAVFLDVVRGYWTVYTCNSPKNSDKNAREQLMPASLQHQGDVSNSSANKRRCHDHRKQGQNKLSA